MKRVLVSDPISESGKGILESAGFAVDYFPEISEQDLIKLLPNIHGWVIRSGTNITSDYLAHADQLEAIGRAGVGVDNVDIGAGHQAWRCCNEYPGS